MKRRDWYLLLAERVVEHLVALAKVFVVAVAAVVVDIFGVGGSGIFFL